VALVVDASVTMAWCFADEVTPAAEAALDRLNEERAFVPELWSLEVANVLLLAERRGRISEAQVTRFLALVDALPITVDPTVLPRPQLIAKAREHGLATYDAAYLLTAELYGASLATNDAALAAAAAAAGVELVS
jgi:predicted nucleic acid-binding protein